MLIRYRPLNETGQYGESMFAEIASDEAEDVAVRTWVEGEYGSEAAGTFRRVSWSGSDYGFVFNGIEYGVAVSRPSPPTNVS